MSKPIILDDDQVLPQEAKDTRNAELEAIQNFKGKYPKQLWYLFLSEMWERFSFYGMRGMLTIFMVHKLLLPKPEANLRYGATQAFVYAMTFIGGLFADKILGFRKSLFWGGFLMIIGSFVLAFDPEHLFFLGISFTIIGTGFFKPNISTMVGFLYKAGDARRDAGFSLFYSGINIGALFGGLICVGVGQQISWNLAFSLAGIFMTIGLLIFIYTKRLMGPIGLSPLSQKMSKAKKWATEYGVYLGSLLIIPLILVMVRKTEYTDLFMYIVGPATLIYLFWEMRKYSAQEIKKLWGALFFILVSIPFWAFFEQAGGSLSLFANDNLRGKILGIPFLDPVQWNNAANSIFVIACSPVAGLIWLWMNKKGWEPNTVVKFGIAFLFNGLGFYVFYTCRFFADAQGYTSLNVFTLAYFLVTLGELCLSPIGLSIITKLSPKPLQGVMMGLWFLASAYGQYAAGLLGADMSNVNPKASNLDMLISYCEGYKQLGLIGFGIGVVIILVAPLIRKLMQEVK